MVLEGEESAAPEKDEANEELKKAIEEEKGRKKEEEEKKKADDLFAGNMKNCLFKPHADKVCKVSKSCYFMLISQHVLYACGVYVQLHSVYFNANSPPISPDFMKDVSRPKPRPKPAAGGGLGSLMTSAGGSSGSAQKSLNGLTPTATPAQPGKVTVTKVFDFAGEAVTYVHTLAGEQNMVHMGG